MGAAGRLMGAGRAAMRRPRIQFLCLHHHEPRLDARLRALVSWLRPGHDVLAYSDGIDRIIEGSVRRPAIAFTYDDGLGSHLRAGEVLHELGVSACFFVCPGLVGVSDAAVVRAFCRERLMIRPVPVMGWSDLERLRELGHEVGCHGMTHAPLAAMPLARAEDEIADGRRVLIDRLGRADHFAWPYGRFEAVSARVVRAVFDAGFRTCASAEPGCHVDGVRAARSLCVRRQIVESHWTGARVRHRIVRSSRFGAPGIDRWPSAWRSMIEGESADEN